MINYFRWFSLVKLLYERAYNHTVAQTHFHYPFNWRLLFVLTSRWVRRVFSISVDRYLGIFEVLFLHNWGSPWRLTNSVNEMNNVHDLSDHTDCRIISPSFRRIVTGASHQLAFSYLVMHACSLLKRFLAPQGICCVSQTSTQMRPCHISCLWMRPTEQITNTTIFHNHHRPIQ